ncbi:MAG: hypothetical protein J6L76_02300 [Clostridia bacterium]|nr:hypothetical protein [Clostridia bacterium]
MRVPNSATERQMLEGKYRNSRNNILLVVIFTAVNILLLVAESNTYFLFSAFIPYILVDFGRLVCGMYPAEFYEPGVEPLSKGVFAMLLIIAIVILAVYLLCWIFSKKNKVGWLITALALFAVDTLCMFLLGGIQVEQILDIVFHVWVVVSLAIGIHAHFKLKKIPEQVIEVEAVEVQPAETEAEPEETQE